MVNQNFADVLHMAMVLPGAISSSKFNPISLANASCLQ